MSRVLGECYAIGRELNYEPDETQLVSAVARATGRTMEEVAYDLLCEGEGDGVLINFSMNYVGGSLDATYEMLSDPNTVSGLSDGGAHLQLVCDAAMPTFQLSFWARDRSRGPTIPIETIINKVTGQLAALYGLDDRGILAPGRRADINVIDFDKLESDLPRMVFDMPAGGPRFVQISSGYRATLVNGVVTRRNDVATGATPGRLVRAH